VKRKLAYTKTSLFHGDGHLLQCSICGDNHRDNLIVEDLGLSVGMSGDDYSFCKKCWGSKDLGEKILALLGYPKGMKILNEMVEIKEIGEVEDAQ